METEKAGRAGVVVLVAFTVVPAVVAGISVWWVLTAQTAPADDQTTRATLAGWVIAILASLASLTSSVLLLVNMAQARRERARANAAGVEESPGGTVVTQHNYSGGTGFVGGRHDHNWN